MAGTPPNPGPWARCRHSALLLLLFYTATPARSALASNPSNSVELDLISPVEGGHYRVNPNTGLGVVVAVHNKAVADSYEWTFEWEARSSEFHSSGSIRGRPEGWRDYDESYFSTIQNETIYIGVSHPYFFSGSNRPNDGPMPDGEYRFSWHFDIGPWCGHLRVIDTSPGTNGSQGWDTWIYSMTHTISSGAFNISVADDAPWPAFTPTSCPSVAGQVSFATQRPVIERNVSPDTGCETTESVTELANPCLATVGLAQAASISSVMQWGIAAPTPTASSSSGFSSAASSFSDSLTSAFSSSASLLSVTEVTVPSPTPTESQWRSKQELSCSPVSATGSVWSGCVVHEYGFDVGAAILVI
ncbi:hypothetical protein B0T22DRAFT_461366 [Podospora appendiculata]|uniref:DUF7136 domain-containing protein n=1 Tax=Podospora appendiculata TaxID=314037 RepID=A0AAE1CDE7_9PEZI|nr:hypothetical protein B0T22DRAFT_461366 [Podospora appendiculata]